METSPTVELGEPIWQETFGTFDIGALNSAFIGVARTAGDQVLAGRNVVLVVFQARDTRLVTVSLYDSDPANGLVPMLKGGRSD